MELIIKDFKATEPIQFNYEELKKELADKLVKYRGATYDDSAISLAKKDRAALNNLKDTIEGRRKEIKADCLASYTEFELKIKDIVAMIDKPVQQIDTQIKTYEQKLKDDKKAEIEKFFNDNVDELDGIVVLDKIFNPKWLNVTYGMKKIMDEIDGIFKKVSEDLEVINGLNSEFDVELKNVYLNSMDLSEVLRKKTELEERKKRLEELEEQKRLQAQNTSILNKETVSDSQSTKAITENVTYGERSTEESIGPVMTLDFRVWVTSKQMSLLKEFLSKNNIKYGRVPEVA